MILLHWCISDVPISQDTDNYDQEYYLYESDTKPAAIEEDLKYHEEYLNVSDDQDDNFLKNQDDNSLKDEDDPQSDNQIHVCILKFLLLWGSFYGISAAALNHLIKVLHYILSLMSPTLPQVS